MLTFPWTRSLIFKYMWRFTSCSSSRIDEQWNRRRDTMIEIGQARLSMPNKMSLKMRTSSQNWLFCKNPWSWWRKKTTPHVNEQPTTLTYLNKSMNWLSMMNIWHNIVLYRNHTHLKLEQKAGNDLRLYRWRNEHPYYQQNVEFGTLTKRQ